jgi:hypothetical protein
MNNFAKAIKLPVHVSNSSNLDFTLGTTFQNCFIVVVDISLVIGIKRVVQQGVGRYKDFELVFDVKENAISKHKKNRVLKDVVNGWLDSISVILHNEYQFRIDIRNVVIHNFDEFIDLEDISVILGTLVDRNVL